MSGGRSVALVLVLLIIAAHFIGPIGASWRALWGPSVPIGLGANTSGGSLGTLGPGW